MGFQFKSQNEDGDDNFAEINIIPLVDVMLVLLIIFMVTAPLSIGGLNVDLPFSKAKSATIDENRIVVTVTNKGDFFIDKMQIPGDQIELRMKSLFQFREKKELYIRADRQVVYGRVVDLMTAAKVAGVRKISMLTQTPN